MMDDFSRGNMDRPASVVPPYVRNFAREGRIVFEIGPREEFRLLDSNAFLQEKMKLAGELTRTSRK